MKKLFTLLLALVATTTLWAEDFSVDGIYYKILNGSEVEVTYRGSSYNEYADEYSGSVIIPSTVTYKGTTYSVTSIGNSAFYKCSSLTSVIIPNRVTSIGDGAFVYCSSLTSVIIPNSVTSIGDWAFDGCSRLSFVTLPKRVTSIGDYAFRDCSSLSFVTLPNRVTTIGTATFRGCSSLTSVIIPNSVTSIGAAAFSGCSKLTSVTIPNSVTSIGGRAFYNCSGLTSVISLAEIPPTLRTDVFYNVSTTIPVYVPCSSVSAYQSAKGWKDFTNIQCMPEDESAVDNINSQSTNVQKLIRDGQLLIIRDGVEYNAMGAEIQ